MKIAFLKAGGVFNGLCALLHLGFPGFMKWDETLALLPQDKSPFVEQPLFIMNWCLLIFWVILAWLPLFYSHELLETRLGRSIMVSLILFWIIRICILQPVYIGVSAPISWGMIVFFMIGLLLFSVPLGLELKKRKQKPA